jgi:DNA replication licensing factor MCM2
MRTARTCSGRTLKSAPRQLVLSHGLTDFYSSDYAVNQGLDQFSDTGLDDEGDFDAMDPRARAAAEAQMRNRDRREGGARGTRAARRSRPTFLDSDDVDVSEPDGGLLAGLRTRTRRQYDERPAADDMDGVDDVRAPVLRYVSGGC